MDAECFKSFSDDLLLPLKELLQTTYIFLEAEIECSLSWITVFFVESVTLSNKSTMKPLCWNTYRNVVPNVEIVQSVWKLWGVCRYAELSDPQEVKLELIVKLLGNSEYTQIKQLKWLLEDEVNWMDKGASSYYIT